MAGADLSDVAAIAGEVHPLLPERPDVLAEKRRLFPDGAFVLRKGSASVGYAFAHPWPAGEIPALDAYLGAIPAVADCLFLHDVAILPAARGSGSAAKLMARLEAVARASGLRRLALASIYGTKTLWRRLGFEEAEPANGPTQLASYGAGACYMIRRL